MRVGACGRRAAVLGFVWACVAGVSARPAAAQPAETEPLGGGSAKAVLHQNWSADTRERYWFWSQGSQLLDYQWFLHLEQAGSRELFRSDAHMDALRFVTVPRSPSNPDALPVGFTQDPATKRVGFTCAACHTAQIDYRGRSLVIDGGPALAHFDRFLAELVAALDATVADTAKFERFATAVQGPGGDRAKLKRQIAEEVRPLRARVASNGVPGAPPGYPGFGRLDAYGQIFNQVAGLDLGIAQNVRPPNAPASYPSLWQAPWADVVLWNGGGRNRLAVGPVLIGPVLRDAVEVVGVFGRLAFEPVRPSVVPSHHSEVDFAGLGRLEHALCSLHAPPWPATVFGPIDMGLADEGKHVYEQHCIRCHARVADEQPYESPLRDVGTDPTYMHNAHDRQAETGELAGLPKVANVFDLFPRQAPAYEVLQNAVIGVVMRQLDAAVGAADAGRCDPRREPEVPKIGDQEFVRDLERELGKRQTMPLGYRVRALNGVWATAPYLHNGSVPTLADLLEPEDRRPRVFSVGNREYDPERVGFVSTRGPGTTEIDTTATGLGSSNQGHPAAWHLTAAQRRALLEYLKTL